MCLVARVECTFFFFFYKAKKKKEVVRRSERSLRITS